MTDASTPTPGSPPRRGPGRRLVRLAGLLALELVAVAALLEVALRVAHGYSPGLRRVLYLPGVATTYDEARNLRELLERTTHGFRPFTRHRDFVLNSRGFKTIEYTEEKPPGCLRVVVLGDSYAFSSGGVPFDDLWHQQLRAHLVERRGDSVEVLNLGVPAVGPDFYRRMWQLEGSRLHADLLIVGFYVGNDFFDVRPVLAEDTAIDRWARRSHLARLVRNWGLDEGALSAEEREAREQDVAVGVETSGGRKVIDSYYRYDPTRPSLSQERFLQGHQRNFRMFDEENSAELEASFDKARNQLEDLLDETRAGGVPLVVMIIPSEPQVNLELAEFLAERRRLPFAQIDLEAPNRLLVGWLQERGVPVLDLLPLFRERADGELLYRRFDTHWSDAGNRLAGRALADHLLESGLVD